MTMRPFHLTTTTAALMLALLGAGLAPTAQAQSANRACRAVFAKFCKGVTPGEGRVLACLRQHQDQISADCKASLETAQACADQARQLCGGGGDEGKAPDRKAMRECLQQQREALSASCRSQLAVP